MSDISTASARPASRSKSLTQREPALVTPFWVRIATETSLSPGWLLIAFPAVLYPTYLALEALFGRGWAAAADLAGDFEARLLPINTAWLGYMAMTGVYWARGTFRDLEALRPTLPKGEAGYDELRQQLLRFERRRLWAGALFAVALGSLLQELVAGRWTGLFLGEWSLREPFIVATALVAWLGAGLGSVYLIDSARLYSHIGERYVAVDLLNLAPLSPLTHHGLRVVLSLMVITVPWVMITAMAPSSFSGPALAFGLLAGLPIIAAAFLLPVRGLRRQIRARKAEELLELREKIGRDRELADGHGPESAEAGARLPGLLAFEKRIESVREWPFDAPTLTRFFLYIAIPLGSWIGGALVERLLGAALD